jgi:hypothetical protein
MPGASRDTVYDYTVTDVNPISRLVAVRDQHGWYHAAHCTSDLPVIGDCYSGALPLRGFRLLVGAEGQVCRMTFSQVKCSAQWVGELIHHDPASARRIHMHLPPHPEASAPRQP